MQGRKELLQDFYKKYAPQQEVTEERLEAINNKYGDDDKALLNDFYAKYAPNQELTDDRFNAISKKYKLSVGGDSVGKSEEVSTSDLQTPAQPSGESGEEAKPIKNIVQKEYDDITKNIFQQENEKVDTELQQIEEQARELGAQQIRLEDAAIKVPLIGSPQSYEASKQDYEAYNQNVEMLNNISKELSDRYMSLAKKKYDLALAERDYDLFKDKEVREATQIAVGALPLGEQVTASLIGAGKSVIESMAGALYMDRATSGMGVSEEEIENASPAAREAMLEAKRLVNESKTEDYKKAEEMYEKSAETAEQYGLVQTMKDIDSPQQALSFVVSSFGEQIPQFIQGALTLGMGTYIQEKSGITREIIQSQLAEGKTLQEALDSDEVQSYINDGAAALIASFDLLGLASMGSSVFAKNLMKKGVVKVLAYLTEPVTEIAQEQVSAATVQAQTKGETDALNIKEGLGYLPWDEVGDVFFKSLIPSTTIKAVTDFSNTGKPDQELLNAASTNPKTQQMLKGIINARQKAGIITEEQAQLQIGDLEKGIEANLQIPEDIQGEQRAELVELQKLHDELTEAKSQASPAFAPTYNERLKNVEEQMQEVASRKEERTTVEQYGDKKEVKTGKEEVELEETDLESLAKDIEALEDEMPRDVTEEVKQEAQENKQRNVSESLPKAKSLEGANVTIFDKPSKIIYVKEDGKGGYVVKLKDEKGLIRRIKGNDAEVLINNLAFLADETVSPAATKQQAQEQKEVEKRRADKLKEKKAKDKQKAEEKQKAKKAKTEKLKQREKRIEEKNKKFIDKFKEERRKEASEEKEVSEYNKSLEQEFKNEVREEERYLKEYEKELNEELRRKIKEEEARIVEFDGDFYYVEKRGKNDYKILLDGKSAARGKVRSKISAKYDTELNQQKQKLKAEKEEKLLDEMIASEDRVETALQNAIDFFDLSKNKAFKNTAFSSIGVVEVPAWVIKSSLQIVKATYKATKNLVEALSAGYAYIIENNPNVKENDFNKFVIQELKKQTKDAVQKPSAKKVDVRQQAKDGKKVEQKDKGKKLSEKKDKIKEAVDSKKQKDKKATEKTGKKQKPIKVTDRSFKPILKAVNDFIKQKVYSYEKTGELDSDGKPKRRRVTTPYTAKQFKKDMAEFGFNDALLMDLFIVANPEIKSINKKRVNAAKNIDRNKLGGLGLSLKNIAKIPTQFIPLDKFDKYYEALEWLGQRTSNFDSKEFRDIKNTLNEVSIEADYQMGMYDDIINELSDRAKTKEDYLDIIQGLLNEGEINQTQFDFLNKNKPKQKPEPKERKKFGELEKPKRIDTRNLSPKEREKVRVLESVTDEDYELLSDAEARYFENVLSALNEEYVPTSAYDMASKILANRAAKNMEQSVKARGGITLNKIRDLFWGKIKEKTESRIKKANEETIDSSIGLRGTAIRDTMRMAAIQYGAYKETVDNIRKEMSKIMKSFDRFDGKKAQEADIKVMMFRLQRQKDANKNATEVDSVKAFIERMSEDETTKRELRTKYGQGWIDTVNRIYNEFKDKDGELNKEKLYAKLTNKEKRLLNLSDRLVKKSEQFAIDAAAEQGNALELVPEYTHVPSVLSAMGLDKLEDVADTVTKMINGTSFRKVSVKAGPLEKRKNATPVISFSNFESVVKGLDQIYKAYYLSDALKTETRAFKKLKDSLKNDKQAEPIATAIEKGIRETRDALFLANFRKEEQSPIISFLMNNTATALLGTTEKLVKESVTNPAYQLLRYAMKGQVAKIPRLISYMVSETIPKLGKAANLNEKLINDVIVALSPAQINRYLQGQKFSGEQLDIQQDIESFSPYEKNLETKITKGLSMFRNKTGLKRLGEYMSSGNDQVMSRSIFRLEFEDAFKKLTGKKLTKEDYKKIAYEDASFYDKYSEQLKKAVSDADAEVAVGFTTTNEMQRSYEQLTASQKGLLGKMKYFMLPFQVAEYQNIRKAIYNDGLKGVATTVMPILARQVLYNYLAMTLPSVIATALGAAMGDEEDQEDLQNIDLYLNKEDAVKSLVAGVAGMFVFRDMSNYVRLPLTAAIELANAWYGDDLGVREKGTDYNKYEDQFFYNSISLSPDDYSNTLGTSIGVSKAIIPPLSPTFDIIEPTLKSEAVQSLYKDEYDIKEDKYDEMDYYGRKALLKLGIANGVIPTDAYKMYMYHFNKEIIKGQRIKND